MRYKFCVLVFFITCSGTAVAQSHAIDSTRHLLHKVTNDKRRVDHYNQLARLFEFVSQDSMRLYLKKSQALAQKIKYTAGIAKGHIFSGYLAGDIDELDSAIWHFQQAEKYFRQLKDPVNLAEAQKLMAETYKYKGLYKLALKYYQSAMDLFEKSDSRDGVAGTYYSMGAMYQELEQDPKALECYKAALKLNKIMNKPLEVANSTTAIGIIEDRRKNYKAARKLYEEARLIYEKYNYENGLSNLYTWMAITEYNQKNFRKSLDYFMESLRLYEKLNSVTGKMYAYNNIGSIYMELGEFTNALTWQKKGLDLAMHTQIKANIKYAYETLTVTYERMGDYKNAYISGTLYMKYKDSLLNESTAKQLSELDKKYESAKKDKKLLEKDTEIMRQSALAQSQATQRNYFIGGFGAMLIISIIIFRSYNQNKKARRIIASQKNEVERQKEIVELKNKEVFDSIMYAKRLQDAILPPLKTIRQHFPESFVLYKPKDIVAGDFYFMEAVNDRIVFAVADCTGHGVPGAMVSIVCSNALNRAVKEFKITEPGKILDKVRELVLETFSKSESEVKDGMDISLCSLKFRNSEGGFRNGDKEGSEIRNPTSEMSLQWSGANNPLWIIRAGEVLEYRPNKQPIGINPNHTSFTTHTIDLKPNDTLVLFTDGFQDQFGGSGQKFGGKKLKASNMKKLLLSCRQLPTHEQREFLDQAFENWKGDLEQVDDVCLIGVKI